MSRQSERSSNTLVPALASVGVTLLVVTAADRSAGTSATLAYAVMSAAVGSLVWLLLVERRRTVTLARADPLTGVLNRPAFAAVLSSEVARAGRTSHPLTILTIDLDAFRVFNDRMGPRAADEVLCACANALRSSDTVARIDGDTFAVLLPETDAEGASVVLARVRHHLMRELLQSGWPVTFSVGLATFRTPPVSAEEAMLRADAVLAEAKRAGRDTVRSEVFG